MKKHSLKNEVKDIIKILNSSLDQKINFQSTIIRLKKAYDELQILLKQQGEK